MGIDYSPNKAELLLKQTQFITKMLEKFDQGNAHAVRNPLIVGQDLTPSDDHPILKSCTVYRELIGSLLYIANATRPDISYAMSPREMHWRAALRVIHYLKGTSTHGIIYKKSSANAIRLRAYCDANWGGDKQSRRSTSGVLVMLGGGVVVYKCKRQNSVALSSAEAEYMSLALATQEIMWLRYLLKEMGMATDQATTINLDNKSAISIATNQGYTPRAKHIDLHAHFVRDHVEQGNIKLHHVPSAEQLADYLTKALHLNYFTYVRRAAFVNVQVDGECHELHRSLVCLKSIYQH
ncbi:Hypothetical protein PHPALM_436 [Phytophthora palmivora]|uniref:Polyprotein n=1 Tax=Phytophthora palmivora TaxID=4796 RepID=A0A2P4YUT8_9STRA|nr:Hypothetical protein PHPALM_436 [Phytophthora palmivora]